MKNEALEAATELAEKVSSRIPDVRLHGDGSLRGTDDAVLDLGRLVTMLYLARADAYNLWQMLAKTERRRTPTKKATPPAFEDA